MQQYLKLPNPKQQQTVLKKTHRTASMRPLPDSTAMADIETARTTAASISSQFGKKSKKKFELEKLENAYDDSKLLGEIIHADNT